MKNIIEVQNIKKTYGTKEAVKGISFNVEEDEILGLLGPNGSGKTTTIGMLLGLLKPTSGQIFINNLKLEENRIKILEKISIMLNVHIITIPAKDSIGTDDYLGSLAVNSFCAPGLIISSSNYSDFSVGKKLESLGVKTEVCPVSQFQLSGGSVHCLTNEL